MNNLKKHLTERGYPINFVENVLSEVKHEGRKQSLATKQKEPNLILPFVTQFHPAVPNTIISYRRGRSLKDELVRAKL